jgi:peptidyl-prolyl cis-trans isomerase B (cyclophilin B)
MILNKIILGLIFTVILIGFGNNAFALVGITENPVVVFETNLGNIVIELFPEDAIEHIQNFLHLSSTGYYDNTIFHRIIPGFMIQGGDPNTISGEVNTWGMGGPDEKLDAEFNTIKHNRGIVSMARSADPNSAGSQFFIVHQDSPHLDGEYTAFGRLASEESFQTLDKIAELQTDRSDRPIDPEQVRIIKTTIISDSEVLGYIPFVDPERTGSAKKESIGNQIFESQKLGVRFSAPEGWLLQQPDTSVTGAPNVAVVGPKVDGVNPVISLTIKNIGDQTIDDLIIEKNNVLDEAVYANKLVIINQEKVRSNVYQTEAIGNFELDGLELKIKFLEVMIVEKSESKSYTFAYSNIFDNFDNEFGKYQETLNSFELLSQKNSILKTSTESSEEGGGCLIATAAYGSELAPQVQMLREIRDNQLMNTESGSAFMTTFNEFYYSFSPIIADYERENPYFKEAVKLAITPIISSLSIMENAESESEVLSIGISVIALNLAMYLGVPAIVVVGIKRKF